MKQQQQYNFNNENFEDLFKQSISGVGRFENNIVKGIIIAIDQYYLTVDVGLKSEGKILINEFKNAEGIAPDYKVGQEVEVYIDRYEDQDGNIVLSREKAKREESWYELEKLYNEQAIVNGLISKRVKGGFSVVVNDTLAFLPGSQLDVKPIKNINALVGTIQQLQILKMDKKRFNIVVSRKSVISKHNLDNNVDYNVEYLEDQIVEGVIKNITGYGAFVDLGNVDGLLHVTDISWSRINHPSEVLQLGQTVKLKVIKINSENKRISLGMKQLSQDPWDEVVVKYQVGSQYKVKISNTTDYGIFVELAKGIEGLVHISEMSWVKKDINPKTDYQPGQEVEVKVLEIDVKKRRMNLSVKQCANNPWLEFATNNPEGHVVSVSVKEINDSGLVVSLTNILDGFIRLSDISWDSNDKVLLKDFKIGDSLNAKIIKHDLEKDKILLSVKHLNEDPFVASLNEIKKGTTLKVKITNILESALEVKIKDGVSGFIKKNDLALDREEQNLEDFKVGQEIEAMLVQIDSNKKALYLSIKALEIDEQKKSMNSGDNNNSSLADAFANAMSKKEQK
jgi:small subunit ribosomal protein S1